MSRLDSVSASGARIGFAGGEGIGFGAAGIRFDGALTLAGGGLPEGTVDARASRARRTADRHRPVRALCRRRRAACAHTRQLPGDPRRANFLHDPRDPVGTAGGRAGRGAEPAARWRLGRARAAGAEPALRAARVSATVSGRAGARAHDAQPLPGRGRIAQHRQWPDRRRRPHRRAAPGGPDRQQRIHRRRVFGRTAASATAT